MQVVREKGVKDGRERFGLNTNKRNCSQLRWGKVVEEGIKMLTLGMLFKRSIRNLSERVDTFVYIRLEFERLCLLM